MPSTVDPASVNVGPGKIHVDVVSAASEVFNSGASSVLSTVSTALNQPLVAPTSFTYTAAGGGDATRVLSGDGPYFVGANLVDLFKVVNSADDTEIFNPATGLYVSVASVNVPLSGYVNTLTLTFNTPIPGSTSYKVYYGKKNTLLNVSQTITSYPAIRRSAERVRFPEFPRTGIAPTSVSLAQSYLTNPPDPYTAQWKAVLRGSAVSAYNNSRGGAIGYVHTGTVPNVIDGTTNDQFLENLAGAAFFSAFEKDIRSASFATPTPSTALTKIDSTLVASTAADQVTLNASDYFRTATPTSSLRRGLDMLEITFSTGVKQVVVPTTFHATNIRIMNCVTLGGATCTFPTDNNVRVKWIRPNFFAGGAHGKIAGTEFNFVGMGVFTPGCITTSPVDEVEHAPPFYSAGTLDIARAGANGWNLKAFTWGSFQESDPAVANVGKKVVKGELRGDGSLYSLGGHIEGLLTSRFAGTVSLTGSSAYAWNPFSGATLNVDFTATGGTKVLTLTLDANYLADQKDGDEITVFIRYLSGLPAVLQSSVVWPTQFVFSGKDDDVRGNLPTDTMTLNRKPVIKLTGMSLGGVFYMTRTDYEVP